LSSNSEKTKIAALVIFSILFFSAIRTGFVVGKNYRLREDWSFNTSTYITIDYPGVNTVVEDYDRIDSPLQIRDINNDDQLEFIFRTSSEELACYSIDGTRIWITYKIDNLQYPVVDDLDNDLFLETIFSTYGYLYVFDHAGEMIWNTWSMDLSYIDSPYILDLDNDSLKEIFISSSYSNKAYCFDHTGNLLWNFTAQDGLYSYTYSYAIPTSADLDNDGYQEILFSGADVSHKENQDNKFYCLNYNGTLRWEIATDGFVSRTAIVEDINNDNESEILLYSRNHITGHPYLYCLDANGTLIWKNHLSSIYTQPICYDIDNDDFFEIIYSYTNTTDGKSYIECYNYHYDLLWQATPKNPINADITAADIDNDTIPEILGYRSKYDSKYFYCFTNSGELKWKYKVDNFIDSYYLLDIDLDGFQEIICVQHDSYVLGDIIACFKLYDRDYFLGVTLLPVCIVSVVLMILIAVVIIYSIKLKRMQRTSRP